LLPKPRSLRRALALASLLSAGLSLAAAPAALATLTPAAPPIVWSQFQGDPAHTGALPANATTPEPPYARAWRFSFPGSDQGVSAPVIAGDVAVAVGSTAVYGVDDTSGGLLWQVPRTGGPITAPALANSDNADLVLFTEGPEAASSKLIAFDLKTQKTVWEATIGEVSGSGVTVDGATAFVGDDTGKVRAFDVKTGKETWTSEGVGRVEAPVAVSGGLVYVASRELSQGNARIRALDETTGAQKWSFSQQGLTSGSAVAVSDGLAVAGFTDRLARAFDAQTGAGKWASLLSSAVSPRAAPAAAPGATFIADLSGTVERFSSTSGDRIWDYRFNGIRPLPIPYLVFAGSPAYVHSSVLIGLGDGRLAAISVATGHLVWASDTGPGALGAIALGDGVVVVAKGGADSGLVGFRPDPSGKLLDVPSPTQLDPPKLLENYAIAFVVVFGLVAVPFGLLRRRGTTPTEQGTGSGEVVA
jgi:outer membrane protein assembly factor BamB